MFLNSAVTYQPLLDAVLGLREPARWEEVGVEAELLL